ncbi:iron-sulfur cluster assembly accessory protein [Lyngbya aestuarii]|uniref:iron-sulfur cluster assembly accessory protein n=1 Tax=Lyngbya aestuarii TaxID=118322 RepID=UPI00403E0B76
MINLSQAAAGEVKRLKCKHQQDIDIPLWLRLGVHNGGCSELHYSIEFDKKINSSDQIINCEDISIVVDEKNLQYIKGLTLDYSEDLMGGGFRFHNPNAVETCGCGNSFKVRA